MSKHIAEVDSTYWLYEDGFVRQRADDPQHRAPTEDEDLSDDEVPMSKFEELAFGKVDPLPAPRSATSHTNHGQLGYEHTGFEAGAL